MADRWDQIQDLYHRALARNKDERPRFLTEACAGDDSLRQEVESLLKYHTQAQQAMEPGTALFIESAALLMESGQQIGSYKILSMLGAGGMGEVYRARDLKLKREVAIKMLPEMFSRDVDRVNRFQREAEVLASLNHPNIANIYHLEEKNGSSYLVLELVEGETLAKRIARGPIPVDEALPIARQIAEALEAAHAQGIVHRDLKPGNIMITSSGRVKVLDFGIARVLSETSEGDRHPWSVPSHLNLYSSIPGTPSYMSPEQTSRAKVDGRTDIWAMGCLIFEMVTGDQLFARNSLAATLQSILHTEPNWTLLPSYAPRELTDLLRRCLQKDVNQRLHSAADLRRSIEKLQGPKVRLLSRAGYVVVALAVMAAATSGLLVVLKPSHVDTLRIEQTRQLTFAKELEIHPALSPDGRTLAYSLATHGRMDVYSQPMSGGQAVNLTQDLPASPYRYWPRWSPDGRFIAFVTSGVTGQSIRVIPSSGGSSKEVAQGSIFGHCWSPDGKKLAFVKGYDIYVTSLDTGSTTLVTHTTEPHSLSCSPNGKWITYVSGNTDALFSQTQFGNLAPSTIMIVPADGGEPWALTDRRSTNASPVWMPDSKSILFMSDRGGGRDVYRLQLSDAGKSASEPVRITTGLNALSIDLSADGQQLVYMMYLTKGNLWSMAIPESGPVSVDSAKALTTGSQNIEGVNVSRDEKWLTFDSNLSGYQHIYRMLRGAQRQEQLTTTPSDDFSPSWSPDGKYIAFHSFRNGNRDIFVISADGTEHQQVTRDPSQERYPDWSKDGQSLVFFSDKTGQQEIYVVSQKGGTWGQPRQLTRTRNGAYFPRWSPDGKLISYFDVSQGLMVMSPDGTNVRRLVSRKRGFTPNFPVWSRDSKTIYFRVLDVNSVGGLWSIPAAGGSPKPLVEFNDTNRLEFTADSKTFFFPITEREGDVWVLKFAR